MKYSFMAENGKQKTVEIEDSWIAKQCQLLGITKREAINMWLSDEGYISNETVEELTNKAKINKTGAVGASTKPRKKPTRKPDEDKRHLIAALANMIQGEEFAGKSGRKLRDVEVTNVERMIAFQIGDDKYELTLSKKRKPKI